MKYQNGHNI